MARIRLALLAALFLVVPAAAWAQLGGTQSLRVNAQTGTSYTVLNSDCGKVVSFNNASAIAVTLPQAGAGSRFLPGCTIQLANVGAGNATITPTTSTIGGRASVILQQGGGLAITSHGGNWTPLGIFPALSTNNLVDPDQLPTATTTSQGAVKAGTCLSMGGTGNKTMSVSTDCITLDNLAGVAITSPTNAQVLTFNGTSWVNSAAPSSGAMYDSVTELTVATTTSQVIQTGATAVYAATLPTLTSGDHYRLVLETTNLDSPTKNSIFLGNGTNGLQVTIDGNDLSFGVFRWSGGSFTTMRIETNQMITVIGRSTLILDWWAVGSSTPHQVSAATGLLGVQFVSNASPDYTTGTWYAAYLDNSATPHSNIRSFRLYKNPRW